MGLRCRRADRAGHRGHGGSLRRPRPGIGRGGGGAVEARTTSSTGGSAAGGSSASGFSMACTSSVEALPRDLVERLPHGGQRGSDVGGDRDVVEPDDADVLGHAAPGLEQRADQTDRHVVVRGEHRGHVAVAGQFPARRVAGRGRPVALDDRRLVRAVGSQRLAPAVETVPGRVPPLRAGQVMDGRVPQLQQVLGRGPREQAGADPGGHHLRRGEGGRRAEDEDRHVDADEADALVDRLGDDDAVHALVQQRRHGAGDARPGRLPSC